MVVHLLHRLDIVLVLGFDCLFELILKTILVLDDLLTLDHLRFNIEVELLTILLLF